MFDLDTIITINRKAATQRVAESETTRHCSICRARGGVVLHSAKQRSTVFLSGRTATAFLAKWNRFDGAQDRRDALVESFFTA